jgi:outer membrane protein assembly factor BamB
MNWKKPAFVRRFYIPAATLWVLLANGALLRAEDWPGWRKDGSGVSRETGILQTWNKTENVLWKTPIEGKGLSSPVVWNDAVFLTTAVPGSMRHAAYHISLVLIWGLTVIAVWRYVGGNLRDPLGNHLDSSLYQNWGAFLARKLLLVTFCIAAGYFALAAIKLHVPMSLPTGILLAFVMLLISHILRGRRKAEERISCTSTSPSPGLSWLRNVVNWSEALFVLGMAGAFLGLLHGYVAVDFSYSPHRTWFSCATICSFGLAAAVGSIPRTSVWRVVAAVIAVGLLPVFLFATPPTTVQLPEPDLYFRKIFLVFGGVTAVSSIWFLLRYFLPRKTSNEGLPTQRARYAGPLAIVLLGATLFVSMNYFLPKAVSERRVVRLDRDTGAVVWQTTCHAEDDAEGVHVMNSLATPTPVTDGAHVYVHFGGAGAYCLDFAGHVVWEFKDPVRPAHWGAGSSPVLWKNRLLLTYDVDKRDFTVALDTNTGQVAWEADRTIYVKPPVTGETDLLDSYSTPIVVEHKGVSQLVNLSDGYMSAYDPATGSELWHLENPGAQLVTTPVLWKDLLIFGAGISNYHAAVSLENESDHIQPKIAWEVKKLIADVPSPVVYEDYIYVISKAGIACCREPETGKALWTKRIPGEYLASATAADGKIFVCNTDGLTTVLAAGPEFKILSENPLNESVRASFAISGGHLLIRGQEHLYCIAAPRLRAGPAPRTRTSRRQTPLPRTRPERPGNRFGANALRPPFMVMT